MVVKTELPDELTTVLKQLVMNGQFNMAGRVLHAYCCRMYHVDEATAARWIVTYFRRNFPRQLERHRKQIARARG